jgi:hypothetical protein
MFADNPGPRSFFDRIRAKVRFFDNSSIDIIKPAGLAIFDLSLKVYPSLLLSALPGGI